MIRRYTQSSAQGMVMRSRLSLFALGTMLCVGLWSLSAVPGSAQQGAPRPPGQNPNGMHVYLRAGLKSHQPGLHDYPQFLADWSKILTEHGAVVDGALHGPRSIDLEHTDVIIIYKGDAGYLSDDEKIGLEAYIKRGGGLV